MIPRPSPSARDAGARALRAVGAGLLDLLFPPRCLVCGALAEAFCGACRQGIEPAAGPPGGIPPPPGIADARSVGRHAGPLREAVLRLKFGRKTALARPLGELLAEELAAAAPLWRPHALVPVPIHGWRRLERGFNQAELLAAVAGRKTGLPVLRALRRTRWTGSQVGRGRAARQAALRGAFAAGPRCAGLRLVLVDDVRTTGATLAECAAALRAAGAADVFALTVTLDLPPLPAGSGGPAAWLSPRAAGHAPPGSGGGPGTRVRNR